MKIQNTLRCAHLTLVALVLSIVAVPAAFAGTAFSKIVVFGDSLNDTGNLLRLTRGVYPNAPNYAPGRESNGRVWVEYLASRLGMADKVLNYAVIGAATKLAPEIPTGNVFSDTFPGLEGTDVFDQVLDYLADARGTADPAALYILEGGANDFPRLTNPALLVINLIQSLVTLEARGAKHIMVVNLPDIGKTPRVILGEQLGQLPPGTAAFVSGACAQLNLALVTNVALVSPPDVTITIADTYGFLNAAAANPAAFGLVNVQQPFLIFGVGTGADPATWLFWDDLHATTRGYEIFSEQVITSLLHSYSPSNGKANAQGAINALRGLVKDPKK